MSRRKIIGLNTLLLPLLVLLGTSPAFSAAYTNPFASVKGNVDITSSPGSTPSGSLEYLVSFYANSADKTSLDPAVLGVNVVGGADYQSLTSNYDARTIIKFPPNCLTGAGTSLINDTLQTLQCNGSAPGSVAVDLYTPGTGTNIDLTPYVASFTGQVLYSKSTGHGYIDVTIDFNNGYNPAVESPGALNVSIGPADGQYFRLDSKITASGSK